MRSQTTALAGMLNSLWATMQPKDAVHSTCGLSWAKVPLPSILPTLAREGETAEGGGGGELARRFRCLHFFNNRHRLDADAADALQQIDDVLLVVGEAVGVELLADGRVFRRLFL